MEEEQPRGWVTATLNDLAMWGSGGTPSRKIPKFFNGSIPWFKTGELGPKTIRRAEEYITEEAIEKSSAKIFPKGSVGIAMYGATIGKLSIWGIDASTNQACAVAQPYDFALNNEFLYFFLLSEKRGLIDAGKGGAQPNISQGILKKWPIWLPPHNEQHRIVAKIEELFSELDKGIESLKTARAQLKVYRQAVLKHAFEGKLTAKWREENKGKLETADQLLTRIQKERETYYQQHLEEWKVAAKAWEVEGNPSRKPSKSKKHKKPPPFMDSETSELAKLPINWKWIKVGQITDCIVPNRDKPKTFTGGIPWVTTPDLCGNMITIDLAKISIGLSEKEAMEYRAKIIPVGSVIMTCVGKFGLSAIVHAPLIINQQLHAFLLPKRLEQKYLAYAIKFQKLYFERASTSTTISYLNQERCNSFPLPICAYDEQAKISTELETQFSMIDEIENSIGVNLAKTEALRQSILKKAFSGQLVEQDPNDEPASVLLERIRAEKENPP